MADTIKALKLMNELRQIPVLIKILVQDTQNTRNLYYSPTFKIDRVKSGTRTLEDDKLVDIIQRTEHNTKAIDELLQRKEYLISLIMKLDSMQEKHLLITTFVNCQTYNEAIDVMEISRAKYYELKKQALVNLGKIVDERSN